MKYNDWLDKWVTIYIEPILKIKTCERYKQVIEKHIKRSLGNIELGDLSSDTIQEFISGLVNPIEGAAGLSSSSINIIIAVINNSLKDAYTAGTMKNNRAIKIKRPKQSEKTVDCFSLADQKKIEDYIFRKKQDKLIGILLSLYTGIRIGELMALQWNDIDFERNFLTVSKTCCDSSDQKGYRKIISEPKTESSKRIVPIPKQLMPLLRVIRKKSKTDFVISGKHPNGISIRSYQRTFDLLLKRLDIKHKGFHALRHTFATRALECGMDVRTLSEILGHTNPAITLKRYSHSMIEHKIAMINKLGKLLE